MDRSDYLFDPVTHADGRALAGLTTRAVLRATLARRARSIALIEGARQWTWGELAADCSALAAALRADGIGTRDVVGLHLPNGRAFVLAHLALAELGAVSLPLHAGYGERDLRDLLVATEAQSVFVNDAAGAQRAVAARGEGARVICSAPGVAGTEGLDDAIVRGRSQLADEPEIAPDHPLALIPTSGTESLHPKVCMHSHDGLLSNATEFVRLSLATSSDRLVCASAYTHLFGLLAVHLALVSGCALVAAPRFDAPAYHRLVREAGATMLWAAPPALRDLLAASANAERLHLREVRTAGTVAGAALLAEVRARLADEVVVQWGMSEIGGGITTRHGERPEARDGTIGTPIDAAEVAVVAPDGRPCAIGDPGELWYRRADMLRGYFRNGAATNAALTADGWLRTGDLASLDTRGSVTFAGRSKDVVDRGGVKIGALEIESHLAAHPAVRHVAVVGFPDERFGERAAAVVALRGEQTVTLEELCAFLRARGVAKFKWPERLHVVDELPTTPTNKIAKSAVRAMVANLATPSTGRAPQ